MPLDRIQNLLDTLYAETLRVDPEVRARHRLTEGSPGFYAAMREAYMPVTPDFGRLLYLLVACRRPSLVVEFGTSFGVSTLFIAAALRDNGAGRVVTTELEPGKVARARANLRAARLDSHVEFRVGDARETLRDLPADSVDLLFLDGEKSLYLALLRQLEPALRPGSLIVGDNVDFADASEFRDQTPGYLRATFSTEALGTRHDHQVLLRT
ncbi:O-methyltransferase [Nocardia asteroides]|uniref:O-methyltransferase n=1 Tax=Nocardia asteroides TaxID=1824 RepID=UPI001E558A8D|nr:class I SAM-dependent methyltransferase [Nocardia asteroides]UGT62347.1 class I SAM-dependent methyltransferase [Nocardia asteroides]